MSKAEREPVIYGNLPSESVQTAAGWLAECVERDHGVKNGKTALYWHLISVIGQHSGSRET